MSQTKRWTTRIGLRLIAGFVFVSSVVGLIGRFRTIPPERESRKNGLSIPMQDLHLGKCYESSAHQHSIRLINEGETDVVVEQIESGCDCLRVAPNGGFKIEAGQSKVIQLTLAIKNYERNQEVTASTIQTSHVRARFSNGKNTKEQTWRLEYTVIPTLTIKPGLLNLGKQSIRQARISSTLAVTVSSEVGGIRCICSDGWTAKAIRSDQNNNHYRIAIYSDSARQLGPLTDALWVIPLRNNGDKLPGKQVVILGQVVPDVIATPEEIHLGRLHQGLQVEEAVRLISLTRQEFSVTRIETNLDEIRVIPSSTDRSLYRCIIRIDKLQLQRKPITFHIRHSDGATSKTVTVQPIGTISGGGEPC